jgi:pimeloyl-ACP methyl ester carboxylesterase
VIARLAAGAVLLTLLSLPAAAQTVVRDVPLADGSERVLYAGPANPRATLFLFVGDEGQIAFDDSGRILKYTTNFLIRAEPLWLAQGFAVAIPAPPNGASLVGKRHTAAYADALAPAIDFARTRANAPVWMVGNSAGSVSAASTAARLAGRVAGVVLTSPLAGPSRMGETVFDSDLGAIAVPALVVANRGDTCPQASPGLAPQILAALTRAPRKELVYVESSDIRSVPCEALSPHGFLGIEAETVTRVSDWIRAASAR